MLKLYNTLSNQKEVFESIERGKVGIYTCGPTVYDYAHIGNLAAYTYADTLRRYLDYSGYEVRHIINITDVGHLTADDLGQADSGDDKMLKAALREKKTPEEIAKFYTKRFFEDIEKLGLKKASYYPRATAHIKQMISIIEKLIKKNLAYEKNGNVFYNVEKFKEYGKLSNKKIEDLHHGARLDNHPDKKNSFDFALWLKAPDNHLMKWSSPWGEGYPGWHIECSAMSMEYLGETFDIHTGGEDHVFPHHENEIAQSEGCNGKILANYWLHNRFLLVDGQKMSKSKGNFYTLSDIEKKGFSPMDFRFLVLSAHYQSSLNFTWKSLEQAQTNREKIVRFMEDFSKLDSTKINKDKVSSLPKMIGKIEKSMDDNLNTAKSLSHVFELISELNKRLSQEKMTSDELTAGKKLIQVLNKVFGITKEKKIKIPTEILTLAKKRDQARKDKDFELADKLRNELIIKGYSTEDTSSGLKIKKIKKISNS